MRGKDKLRRKRPGDRLRTGGSPGTDGSPGTGGSPVVTPQAPRLLPGGDTTCWLGAAGHLACWGDNETGEIGLGAGPDWDPTPAAVTIPPEPM